MIGLAGICIALALSGLGITIYIKNLRSLDKDSEDYKYRRNDCLFIIIVALGVVLLMSAMLIDTIFPSAIPIELGF